MKANKKTACLSLVASLMFLTVQPVSAMTLPTTQVVQYHAGSNFTSIWNQVWNMFRNTEKKTNHQTSLDSQKAERTPVGTTVPGSVYNKVYCPQKTTSTPVVKVDPVKEPVTQTNAPKQAPTPSAPVNNTTNKVDQPTAPVKAVDTTSKAPTPSTVNNGSTQPTTSTKNTTTATKAPATTNTGDITAFEMKVVELCNIERQKVGLAPLTADSLLVKGARAKSQDMVDEGYFSHTSPKYGSPFDMMKTFGVHYSAAGENIASGQATPEAVVNAWMNSPGHRANILSTKYTKIGVGYAYTSNGGYHHYWTQWFTN